MQTTFLQFFAILMICMPFFVFTSELHLRLAKTEKEQAFGLMNCRRLPENEGMLFFFQKPQTPSFWMFGCFIDLSIAYLNEEFIIQEIYEMKAHPELMDPNRPISSFESLSLYPQNDPIRKFFNSESKAAKFPASFALEVNSGWFERHCVNIGDKLILHEKENKAYFISIK